MIPPYILLRGREHLGDKVTHHNNMYDLRHTGDFTKAANGGFDSQFVTKVDHGNEHSYVSSTVKCCASDTFVCGADFTDGTTDSDLKNGVGWSLRPFVMEIYRP